MKMDEEDLPIYIEEIEIPEFLWPPRQREYHEYGRFNPQSEIKHARSLFRRLEFELTYLRKGLSPDSSSVRNLNEQWAELYAKIGVLNISINI